jgi:hypothetical protein
MIRKTVLGLAAVVALATAALAPTAASAGYYGYGYGHGYKSYGYSSYGYYKPYRQHCFSKKVWTHYGWEWVRVCR